MLSPSENHPSDKQNMQPPKMQPQVQTGSSTGNPRNKVALAPGHSLMDWIRLGNSGLDLTGVGGRLLDVTPEQLATHCTQDDAWLAIRDKVYNVTHYMNFHPGGQEELMRGVGTDATKLFTQVHAWVNYDSILKKCLVGRYRPRGGDPAVPNGGTVHNGEGGLGQFLATKEEKERLNSKPPKRRICWDWYEQDERGSMVLYCSSPGSAVEVSLGANDRDLTVEVRDNTHIQRLHFTLEKAICWPVRIIQMQDSSKVEIQMRKAVPGHWKRLGVPCEDSDVDSALTDVPVAFKSLRVVQSECVNYNTRLLALAHNDRIVQTVPVGHHVRVRALLHGEEVVRCYTPVKSALVEPSSTSDPTLLYIMVKGYSNGALSSWLVSRPVGEHIEVSAPEGNFYPKLLDGRKEIYLLAAGTGFTPMVGLILYLKQLPPSKCEKFSLLFFNRKADDILWSDQLGKLAELDKRFSVEHILSEADETWVGRHGRMDGEVLRSFLPQRSPQSNPRCFVCVCGPTPFTQITRGLLQVMDYTEQDYHCFLG